VTLKGISCRRAKPLSDLIGQYLPLKPFLAVALAQDAARKTVAKREADVADRVFQVHKLPAGVAGCAPM